ncbi:VOC family protein [Micromonospora craniellae]|uniref:VOC family protein n=1 Tax=Micromonospora craniellae TaxID=2294034 RepID=A0A372G3V6_9ACTN|nr:VOC family protein [Micromonospora craniellae]QOC92913.1 VOC family protein [Micromonospora craniellae]RFS47692.1 VOC family protein [Micromonospora craniellae]
MASRVRWIDVDCADPYTMATFWAAVTGLRPDPDDQPGDEECALLSGPDVAGGGMLFQRVPEGKVAKNRIHLDIQPIDRTRDEEADRLLDLGAMLVADHRRPDGKGWAVLADPEGNEFCVERSVAEHSTTVG